MIKKIIKNRLAYFLVFLFQKVKRFPFLPKKIVFAIDIIFAALCFYISFYLRFVFLDDFTAFDFFYVKLLIYLVVTGLCFFFFNTYSEYVRFSSFRNILRVFMALFCSHVFVMLLFSSFPDFFVYSQYGRVASIISFLLSSYLMFFFRIIVRISYDYAIKTVAKRKGTPLLIYGIDAVHIGIANMIRLDEKFPYTVVGFIARNPLPKRHQIIGSQVYSPEDVFNDVIVNKGIKTILVHAEYLLLR